MDTPLRSFFTFTLLLFLSTGCNFTAQEDQGNEAPAFPSYTKEDIRNLYEKARESGENVPEDVTEWVKQDIARMGAWQYQVVTLRDPSDEELAAVLNELGNERWDCFEVEYRGLDLRLFLKRPQKSYLKAIPVRDILKLVAPGGGDGGE